MNNAQGLSRAIPAEVKRQVRQRCGFGCVVCGAAVFQYDHMVTGFADADVHDPTDITLLCGFHHQMKTAGMLSVETVRRANASPKCRETGFARGPFDIGPHFGEVRIASISALQTTNIISIYGDRVLYLEEPEEPGGPMRLNATLSDDSGVPVMQIVANEWRTPVENWDVLVAGQHITIKRARTDTVLSMRIDPPNRIRFERLHMFHRGVRIDCDANQHATVTFPSGASVSTPGMQLQGAPSCIEVTTEHVRVGAFYSGPTGTGLGGPGASRVYGLRITPPSAAQLMERAARATQIDFLLRRQQGK